MSFNQVTPLPDELSFEDVKALVTDLESLVGRNLTEDDPNKLSVVLNVHSRLRSMKLTEWPHLQLRFNKLSSSVEEIRARYSLAVRVPSPRGVPCSTSTASPTSGLLCGVPTGARLVDTAELLTISEAERVAAVKELHSDLSRIQGIQQDIATLAHGQQGTLDRVERDIAKVKQEAKAGCLTLTDTVEDTANLYESQGGTAGAAVGAVSGIVFGPPGMMIGAAVGGAMGAFFGHLMRRSKGAAIESIREQTIDL